MWNGAGRGSGDRAAVTPGNRGSGSGSHFEGKGGEGKHMDAAGGTAAKQPHIWACKRARVDDRRARTVQLRAFSVEGDRFVPMSGPWALLLQHYRRCTQ